MSRPTTRRPGEKIFCFLLVVLSVFLFWQSYQISGFSALSSPGAFPMATSFAMILASCVVFVHTLKLPDSEGVRFFYHVFPPIVGIVMGLIFIFAVMLESVGFILSSFAFLFVGIQFLYRRSVMTTLTITVFALMVVYVIFRLVFQVVLPEGIVPEREILAAIKNLWR